MIKEVLRRILFISLYIGCVLPLSVKAQALEIQCPNDLLIDASSILDRLADPSRLDAVLQGSVDDWLAVFNFTDNGCSPVATALDNVLTPSSTVGGQVIVTYTVTDNCGNAETCSRTLQVIGTVANPIIVSCPPDVTFDNNATQAQVDSTFNVWVNSFSSFPDFGMTTDLTSLVPPALGGDAVVVTYISEDPNNADNVGTCESSFIPPSSSLTDGNDEIPTMGQWGIASLLILLLIIGVNSLKQRWMQPSL